ncbi:hypothetical protein LJC22_03565 [Desulfosarcina sp. OttesenSCG-928-G10]|nr:hypothetical protein [Desulfosarcina sp. OttesenSCG-928-G10]MDL2322058.1 hypothetical protein [Desulfosarcina sp. OttesenSCG-928-B08]
MVLNIDLIADFVRVGLAIFIVIVVRKYVFASKAKAMAEFMPELVSLFNKRLPRQVNEYTVCDHVSAGQDNVIIFHYKIKADDLEEDWEDDQERTLTDIKQDTIAHLKGNKGIQKMAAVGIILRFKMVFSDRHQNNRLITFDILPDEYE